MLSKIMELLKSTEKPLSLDQLSQQIAAERSALEAMLDHLVQRGKIHKVTPSTGDPGDKQPFAFCQGCRSSSYCADSVETPTYYALIEGGN